MRRHQQGLCGRIPAALNTAPFPNVAVKAREIDEGLPPPMSGSALEWSSATAAPGCAGEGSFSTGVGGRIRGEGAGVAGDADI